MTHVLFACYTRRRPVACWIEMTSGWSRGGAGVTRGRRIAVWAGSILLVIGLLRLVLKYFYVGLLARVVFAVLAPIHALIPIRGHARINQTSNVVGFSEVAK